MTIVEDELGYVSVGTLLSHSEHKLRIPNFQRPYSWTPRHAGQLFSDLVRACSQNPERAYIMGTVILLQEEETAPFEVVDGQQRLLTVHMLRTLIDGNSIGSLDVGDSPVHRVYQELARRVAGLGSGANPSSDELRNFLDRGAQVLQIVTDDRDEAFQFFDSQNYRGKALRPHDLLKAYHLREMADSSTVERRAVVDRWESADENDLDRLFSTYLSRIHWWSRNTSAREFTPDDIDLFKGVSRFAQRLPAADYHRVAKSVLPGLRDWTTGDTTVSAEFADLRNRDFTRMLHQLDTPVAAGHSFFDFAAFMLKEMTRLESTLKGDGFLPFASGQAGPDMDPKQFFDQPRFRFCRELYVAAVLYYSNKFSDPDALTQLRLFRWAFAPRLAYELLGWRSIDNYAIGRAVGREGLSAFALFASIRDSLDPTSVPLEDVMSPSRATSKNDDDWELSALIRIDHNHA